MNRVLPVIIQNLDVKFESDWTRTVVCIVAKIFNSQSADADLDLWSHNPKLIGFFLSSSTTYMWSLKVIGQNCGLYLATRFSNKECHSWPWPMIAWQKRNMVPPFILLNLNLKFESYWTKIVVCIMPPMFYTQSTKVVINRGPCNLKWIGFLLSFSRTYM